MLVTVLLSVVRIYSCIPLVNYSLLIRLDLSIYHKEGTVQKASLYKALSYNNTTHKTQYNHKISPRENLSRPRSRYVTQAVRSGHIKLQLATVTI